MNLKHLLERRISTALEKAGAPPGTPPLVGQATRPEFGDYQSNGVMAAAKQLRIPPRRLAEKVVAELNLGEAAEKVEIAGPGFINVTLNSQWLGECLMQALGDDRLGVEQAADPQTIVVDYSHPNLAKEMHVGHLRSTIIGDAIVRVLDFLGHRVIRHNHVGDWGTQFGMLVAYMDRLEQQPGADWSTHLVDLESFYRSAKEQFDSDPGFAQLARRYVVDLQGGDPRCRALWQRFIDESLRHCEQVYARLGVTLTRADVRPESAYNDDLSRVIEDLEKKGLLTQSQGAQCVFLEEFRGKDGELIPVIVQKSDGGYLYATTDLAAVRYRAGELKADRLLYIVDARQALHLRQVFAVARAAGFAPPSCSLEHHPFGTMLGTDGRPFRTRAGGTVKLMELLTEAEQRAFDLVSARNDESTEAERRQIAQVVGIGSVKYADLSMNRTTDYIFDWDRMLGFDGNTAPYLQYSYVRVKSIFRRGELDASAPPGQLCIAVSQEKHLALRLAQFAETVEAVAADCYPNLLCNYLYELAEAFMKFYECCPVLKSAEPVRTSRLLLCLLTARTIQQGLELLGIGAVERM